MGACRVRLKQIITLPRRAANAHGSYSANGSLQAMVVSTGSEKRREDKDQERRGEWDCYYDVACRLEKVLRKKSTPGLSPTMGPTGSGGEDLAGPGLSCAGAAVAIRKHV